MRPTSSACGSPPDKWTSTGRFEQCKADVSGCTVALNRPSPRHCTMQVDG
jgi:hypothetical protein